MSDTYIVERSGLVAGTPEQAFDLVNDFHAWPRWSPWEGLDPALSRTYSGAEAGTGAAYSWTGNKKAGSGHMEITGSERPVAGGPGKVVLDLEFLKPFKSTSTQTFTIIPEGGGTRMTWTMVGRKQGILKVIGFLFNFDKMVGPDFEKGLRQLDEALRTSG